MSVLNKILLPNLRFNKRPIMRNTVIYGHALLLIFGYWSDWSSEEAVKSYKKGYPLFWGALLLIMKPQESRMKPWEMELKRWGSGENSECSNRWEYQVKSWFSRNASCFWTVDEQSIYLIEAARSRREINKLMEQVVFLDIAKERRTVWMNLFI